MFSRVPAFARPACWPRPVPPLAAADAPREVIARAALAAEAARQRELLVSLAGRADDSIAPLLDAWRKDALFVYPRPDGTKIAVQLAGEKDGAGAQAATRVDTGAPLLDPTGRPLRLVGADLTAVEHNASLRRAMKAVLDLADLAAPDPARTRQGHRDLRPRSGHRKTPGPARPPRRSSPTPPSSARCGRPSHSSSSRTRRKRSASPPSAN
jgi:hypothetical protein